MGNVRKRSIVLEGQKTSVSLEDEFWDELKNIARSSNVTLSELICEISAHQSKNLSSAIRVHVLGRCLLRLQPSVSAATEENSQNGSAAAQVSLSPC